MSLAPLVRYAKDVPAAVDPATASALRIAVMRLGRRLRAERSPESLPLSQMAALASLERHGTMTPGELAACERVQPPSMTRIIAMLEDGGYVRREPHASDRRQAVLSVTETGHRLLDEDRRRRDAWLARRLAELDPDELALLGAVLPVLDRLAST